MACPYRICRAAARIGKPLSVIAAIGGGRGGKVGAALSLKPGGIDVNWMLLPFHRYAEFSGRSRRKEYWMFTLLNLIVASVIGLVVGAGLPSSFVLDTAPTFGGSLYAGLLLAGIWVLAVLIPSIAVTVRRLHDRDLSGWWYLGFLVLSAVPIVGIVASIAFLVVLCLDGTRGPNRFGDDPKQSEAVIG
jgi:uncharacterized membrane protein YhaH (DUF805 family)